MDADGQAWGGGAAAGCVLKADAFDRAIGGVLYCVRPRSGKTPRGSGAWNVESTGIRTEMNLQTVVTLLEGELISREADLDQEVIGGAAADLMSDVLAFARPDCVLLTGLTHPQVVRTAEMAGVRAIVFVRGKRPPADTVALAEEIEIPLIFSRFSMYEACGRLFTAGLAASMPALPIGQALG